MKNISLKFKKNFSLLTSPFSLSGGQALVTLLFFITIGITIMSAAAIILLSSSYASSQDEQGTMAYEMAETGVENALVRILRDPNYVGETLEIEEGRVIIEASGNPPVIISRGEVASAVKRIRVETEYQNHKLSINNWKEIN